LEWDSKLQLIVLVFLSFRYKSGAWGRAEGRKRDAHPPFWLLPHQNLTGHCVNFDYELRFAVRLKTHNLSGRNDKSRTYAHPTGTRMPDPCHSHHSHRSPNSETVAVLGFQ